VVGSWLTKSIVRHDVRRHIESGLNRKLKSVFHEAAFANIVINVFGPCQISKLADAGLDEGEFLGDELGVGHAGLSFLY
jgi:hypothetical protein